MTAALPVPETLLAPLPADTVSRVVTFYASRGTRNGGWGDPAEELLTFATLPDGPAVCLRLTARLACCLLPRWDCDEDRQDESPAQLLRHLRSYLPDSSPAAGRHARDVLAAALGMRVPLSAHLTRDPGTTSADGVTPPADIDVQVGAVGALHVMVDYVTGCFALPGLSAADVVAEAGNAQLL